MTMKELADALGYSLDYIWRIETNRARPSGKIMQALADYFGADLLLDVPEDGESRAIAEQLLRELPADVREWLRTSGAKTWLYFSAKADQQGLTPEQVQQALYLYRAAKECLSAENTDGPKE